MLQRNPDADLLDLYLQYVKCQQAHHAAEARWRAEGVPSLRGRAASRWKRVEELTRKKQRLAQQLRRRARAYAPNGDAA